MPIRRTIKYEMTPLPCTVKLWTEVEMAEAIGITPATLRRRLEKGTHAYSYHFREPRYKSGTNKDGFSWVKFVRHEYFFNESSYRGNIRAAKMGQKKALEELNRKLHPAPVKMKKKSEVPA